MGNVAPLLVIGLDAGEWSLVRRWADSGDMPVLARMLEAGAHGVLSTTADALPDTVWSCVYGGRNPATFAKYFYVQYDPRTGDLRHVRDDEFTDRPFWAIASSAGRSVGVIDAVKYPCGRDLNGYMLTNWGAHATKCARRSWPPELLDEVDRRFPRHPVGHVDRMTDSASGRRAMRRRLLEGVALRGKLARWAMREHPTDLVFVGFSEMHQSGHFFWQGIDDRHPRHREIVREGVADTVREVYTAVDREIGALAEAAGSEARCLVVAGHGMGPLYHASWSLPEILDLLGFGRRPGRRAEAGRTSRPGFWRLLKMVVPGWLQYTVKDALPRRWQDELLFRWYAGRRDWRGWRAFAVPNNDTCGAIRINVRGRDRHGRVEPGSEYESVLAEVEAALTELRDPDSGRPVVCCTTRPHERFAGPFTDHLPDLIVHWNATFPWSAVASERLGVLRLRRQDARTGGHTDHGFFVATGFDIRSGREIRGGSVYDVAPTVLAALDVPIPEDLEGRPLPILETAALEPRP